ncbi:MAG: hypothetical protein RLZZ158_1835 [Cyanobacteriota bacterium]
MAIWTILLIGFFNPLCFPAMAARLLSADQLSSLSELLPNWQLRSGKLHRQWSFADFSEAFAFMTRVALAAEQLGHHPEWSNCWNRVTIDLVTHDLRGISTLDRDLALQINTFI